MTGCRTYVDANILIAAFKAKGEVGMSALRTLDNPDRVFVISDYLRLETIPKPAFHNQYEEVEFLENFFRAATDIVESSPKVLSRAIELASRYDLAPIDGLHLSAAIEGSVAEFVTLEKERKPLWRVNELNELKVISPRD